MLPWSTTWLIYLQMQEASARGLRLGGGVTRGVHWWFCGDIAYLWRGRYIRRLTLPPPASTTS